MGSSPSSSNLWKGVFGSSIFVRLAVSRSSSFSARLPSSHLMPDLLIFGKTEARKWPVKSVMEPV